jgi:electron transport complex protein RnfG
MTQATGAMPPVAPAPPEALAGTPGPRLVATLGSAGALAGLLIVLVWRATTPSIEAHRASLVQAAIAEVLPSAARWDTLYLESGALTSRPAADVGKTERIYRGVDDSGKEVGFAIQSAQSGFADVITVMFSIDPTRDTLLAMKVLTQKETPGLGDKIEKDSNFVKQFSGVRPPLQTVKAGSRRTASDVDAITGATISSRTIVKIINNATARWQPLIAAYQKEGAR